MQMQKLNMHNDKKKLERRMLSDVCFSIPNSCIFISSNGELKEIVNQVTS